MRKNLIFIVISFLSTPVFSDIDSEVSRLATNCETVARIISTERGMSGVGFTKERAITRAKLIIEDSGSLKDEYYVIVADTVFSAVDGLDGLMSEGWDVSVDYAIKKSGILCKVEYLESIAR